MLTKRQAEMLAFIEEKIAENGVSPSYREISEGLKMASTSQVFKIIDVLVERNFLKKLGGPGCARRLQVIKPQTHLNPEYIRGYQDGLEAGRQEEAK